MEHETFFAYLARMRYITRWGLMRSTVPENVQEHSHMVAVFAHALALIRRDIFHQTDADPGAVAVHALYHDAAEIFTGDLPTPVKYQNAEIREAYQKIEDTAADRLLALLPEELKGSYRPLFTGAGGVSARLVRAADKLSAHVKCLEELRAGNDEFKNAARQTKMALDAFDLPELDYFLMHFLPAFSLTLDELQLPPENDLASTIESNR